MPAAGAATATALPSRVVQQRTILALHLPATATATDRIIRIDAIRHSTRRGRRGPGAVARVETPRAFESSMMPCLKTFVASIRVSRAREVSRPRPSLGGDPEDRRHQKRNGKRRSPDPELARARGRDRRYRAGTRLADSKRNGKGVEGRTGRTNRAAVYKMCRPCWAAAIFSVCSSVVPDWCAVRGALIGRSLCRSVFDALSLREKVFVPD